MKFSDLFRFIMNFRIVPAFSVIQAVSEHNEVQEVDVRPDLVEIDRRFRTPFVYETIEVRVLHPNETPDFPVSEIGLVRYIHAIVNTGFFGDARDVAVEEVVSQTSVFPLYNERFSHT